MVGILASDESGNKILGQIGGISLLVELAKKFQNDTTQIQTLCLVLQACQYAAQDDNNAKVLSQIGNSTFTALSKHNDTQLSRLATNLLKMIVEETEEEMETVSNNELAQYQKDLRDNEDKQYNALCKIFDLCQKEENRIGFRDILPDILACLKSEFAENLEVAAGAISQLALNDINNAELGARNAVALLRPLLKIDDENILKNTLFALGNLAYKNVNNREDINQEPILLSLLNILKKKDSCAEIILKILVSLSLENEIRLNLKKYQYIDVLISLLDVEKLKFKTASVLWNLSVNEEIHQELYEKGALATMTALLANTDMKSRSDNVKELPGDAQKIIDKIRAQRSQEKEDRDRKLKSLNDGKPAYQNIQVVGFGEEEEVLLPEEEEYIPEEIAEELAEEVGEEVVEELQPEEVVEEIQPEEIVEELQPVEEEFSKADLLDDLENMNGELDEFEPLSAFEMNSIRKEKAERKLHKMEEKKKKKEEEKEKKKVSEKMDEEKKKKRDEKVHFVVDELFTTEKSYVDSLTKVKTLYMEPLKKERILKDKEYDTIFKDVDIILTVNSTFLAKLSKLFENETELYKDPQTLIGSLFLESAPTFLMYTNYINNYDEQDQAVVKYAQKITKFQNFLNEAALKLEKMRFRQKDLSSLLVTPIQRLPRYKMLLCELLKVSDEGTTGYAILEAAIEQIQKTTLMCNEKKRELEQNGEVIKLSRELGMNELIHEGRIMHKSIKEKLNLTFYEKGKLYTRSKKHKAQLYIMSDLVVLIKGKKTQENAVLFNLYRTKYPLERSWDYDKDLGVFGLVLENEKKTLVYEVEFETKKERDTILKLISDLIKTIEAEKIKRRMSKTY